MAEDRPAGFALVATPPHCSPGVDFFMHEFFLLQPYRGMGIAEQAAATIFAMFKGNWEIFTNLGEKNKVGQHFWRKTVANYTQGLYEEEVAVTADADGLKLIFRFSNHRLD